MLVLAVMLALWFLVVPLVFAGPSGPRSEQVRAERPAVRTAALPACTIIGTQGDDTLVGTAGDDVICALGGDDVIHGRGGDDVLYGSFGDDVLDGGPGDDQLNGHSGDDRVFGGPGADRLHGGGGADLLSGGSGTDIVEYDTRTTPVRVSIGSGANDGFRGERDNVRGDVERVGGGAGADRLVGNSRDNRLYGRGGNDRLDGGRGDDRLSGGRGADRLDGRDSNRFTDTLDCGGGRRDKALADAPDRVSDSCEDVTQPKPNGGNRAPTDLTLSNGSVAENQPAGTLVGRLRAEDRDRGDEHRFSLVAGDGATDNAAFRIDGAELRTAAVFDFEAKSRYSIRVRVSDGHGGALERPFTITVTDVAEGVNHAPTDISLSPASVAENEPAGTTVGTLAAADPDSGQAHTFTLVAGAGDADNGAFAITGSTLKTAAVFDFETKSSYSIRVRASDDGSPPLSLERELTVTVIDESAELRPPTRRRSPASARTPARPRSACRATTPRAIR
jgi:hypothetical protein